MSVSSTTSSISYSGNASTSTAYPVPFQFFDASDLVVVVNTAGVPTTLVNGTGYTVSGGAGSTGSIVTTSAVPNTSSVIITRNTAKTQLTSYTTGDRFPASTHEKALDKLTMLVQEATASNLPATGTATGTAPYVLQAASAGANPTWVPQSAGGIAAGSITNAMLVGSITPAKLSTGGPVWDASGNLTATSFVGNASTATSAARLTTTRTIGLSGDVTGTASFDGSANATIAATLPNGTVTAAKLGTNEQKQIAKAWVNFNGTIPVVSNGTYSRSGNTVTVTTSTAHNLSVSFGFAVISATDASLTTSGGTVGAASIANYYTVASVISATQFTFVTTTTPTGAATGSITLNQESKRASYNVSSITKLGVGDYVVSFATAMADANYSVFCTGSASAISANLICRFTVAQGTAPSTSSIRVGSTNGSAANATDDPYYSVQVFGN